MSKGEFQRNAVVQKGFELLKNKLTKKPILALLDFENAFQVDYDANGTTIEVVLSQEGKPVTIFSEMK
jgi:hypothetical protein